MRRLIIGIGIASVGAFLCAQAAQQEAIGQDLAATIALHGLTCDKVTSSQRNGDSDYVATCQDGNRYHIFVDSKGRVVVQKL